MHPEVVQFLQSDVVQGIGWKDLEVIEVGAQNVNGRARDLFEGYDYWLGVDLVAGPGVDLVGEADEILTEIASYGFTFPRVVSTEVLEHAWNWENILAAMVGILAPGGCLVLTCASPARAPHGANGDPLPLPGEHYQGVSVSDVVNTLVDLECEVVHAEHVPVPGDTRILARASSSGRISSGGRVLRGLGDIVNNVGSSSDSDSIDDDESDAGVSERMVAPDDDGASQLRTGGEQQSDASPDGPAHGEQDLGVETGRRQVHDPVDEFGDHE